MTNNRILIYTVRAGTYLTQHNEMKTLGSASDGLCFDIILVYHRRHISQKNYRDETISLS